MILCTSATATRHRGTERLEWPPVRRLYCRRAAEPRVRGLDNTTRGPAGMRRDLVYRLHRARFEHGPRSTLGSHERQEGLGAERPAGFCARPRGSLQASSKGRSSSVLRGASFDSKNVNRSVDDELEGINRDRVLAQKDVTYSNSMIEAFWRLLEHSWLYLDGLETVTVGRVLAHHGVVNLVPPPASAADPSWFFWLRDWRDSCQNRPSLGRAPPRCAEP